MCRGMEEGSTAELRQAEVTEERRGAMALFVNKPKWEAELRSNEKYCEVKTKNDLTVIFWSDVVALI